MYFIIMQVLVSIQCLDSLLGGRGQFKHYFNSDEEDLSNLLDRNLELAEDLRPYVGNVIQELRQLQDNNKNILFEGAQGSLLDISFGTYPFVTSSNSSVGGISSGAAISPSALNYSLGVTKGSKFLSCESFM